MAWVLNRWKIIIQAPCTYSLERNSHRSCITKLLRARDSVTWKVHINNKKGEKKTKETII